MLAFAALPTLGNFAGVLAEAFGPSRRTCNQALHAATGIRT